MVTYRTTCFWASKAVSWGGMLSGMLSGMQGRRVLAANVIYLRSDWVLMV